MAAVVLKPQYRVASAVVIGASVAQLEPGAADDGACASPVARSSSLTASRINPRRSTSNVTFKFPAVLPRVIVRSHRNVASRGGPSAALPSSVGQPWGELRMSRRDAGL
jgi:hypothetical protein